MPKQKKDKSTDVTEEKADKVVSEVKAVSDKEDKPAAQDKPAPAPVFNRKPSERRRVESKRLTFDQYAKIKGFRAHHVPGLRARCDNPDKLRTANEWDEHLKDY